MTTFLYTHPACLRHDTGYDHPESAARLQAVLDELRRPEFAALEWHDAPKADRAQIARVHDIRYVCKVFEAAPSDGVAQIAPDTILSPGSLEASLRGAGAACAAVDSVVAGSAHNTFCAVRPPGHHAAAGNTMGFCVFNNVAIGVEQARHVHGYRRIAVVDFDVHHGNGTEAIFRRDSDVMVASIHQSLTFPRTGDSTEVGVGNIVNAPVARETSAKEFRLAFAEKIIPRVQDFRPEFLFISAGFDAHIRDPLGNQKLATADFAWLTTQLMGVADEHCGGRVVSMLEGGYNPAALALSCAAHVRTLLVRQKGDFCGESRAVGKKNPDPAMCAGPGLIAR